MCEWYLTEARTGRLLGRHGRPIKAGTLRNDQCRVEAHIKPLLGARAVRSLTVADLERAQADIAAGKTAQKPDPSRNVWGSIARAGAPIAGRSLAMLYTIFAHAERAGVIPHNPAKGVRLIKPRRRIARLSLDQLAALGAALRAEGENPTGVAAIRALALTGFRCSEVLGIKREWLLDSGGVLFPDTKTDAQARPVGKAAMDLFKSQRRKSDSQWL